MTLSRATLVTLLAFAGVAADFPDVNPNVFGPDVKTTSESLPARDRDLQVALSAEQNARKFYRALGEITPETKGVVRDAVLRRLGRAHHVRLLPQPFRVVGIATGKTQNNGAPEVMLLVTNRLDIDADLVALAYRYRWAVELFFRWIKCVLGCRHLLSQSEQGVRIQVYVALIASLLISLWVGRAPTKRTYEMLCFYLSGWASEEELVAHIDRLHLKAPPSCKN